MKVLNFGSLNIDYVYSVDHILKEGETISSKKLEVFPGGKGLNQSIALARAGVPVCHAGAVGPEGEMLLELCAENGVNTEYIRRVDMKSGHTIIQVDKNGQNSILLFGGSNQAQTEEHIGQVLEHFGEGDMLVLQNEINCLDVIIDKAYARGMTIVLNPSPYDEKLNACDMRKVSWFLLNEVEAEQMTGESDIARMPGALLAKYPDARFVLTLGSRGSVYKDARSEYHQDIFPVKAVDTTAAGDTFTGYFLASFIEGKSIPEALKTAALASSIAVSRPGASSSIPRKEEIPV
jgi:ribokinase